MNNNSEEELDINLIIHKLLQSNNKEVKLK